MFTESESVHASYLSHFAAQVIFGCNNMIVLLDLQASVCYTVIYYQKLVFAARHFPDLID